MLSDNYKEYSNLFKKYGITPSDIDFIDYKVNNGQYSIVFTETKYTKQPGYKTFSGANVETTTNNINAEYYFNCITGIAFFHDKVEKRNTYLGNLISRLTCYNPDKTVKVVREFKIVQNG